MALAAGTIVVGDSDAFGRNGGLIAVDPASGHQTPVSQGGLLSRPVGIAVAR